MTETAGMRALLDLEDAAPDVLFEELPRTGAMLWPMARWPVSRAIAEADIGTTVPTYARAGLKQRAVRATRRAIPNPHAGRRAPRADHLFVVSGWTKTPTPAGYENWLTEDFATALGDDAIVVQDAFLDRLSRGQQRPVNPRTFSHAPALERVERAAARTPLPEADRARLEAALREVFRLVPHPVGDAARERAIADALGRAARAPFAEQEFVRLLERVQPRRIYMQTAAYGDRAAQVRAARQRGIEVSELQHGWIGSSHAAYNFGAAMQRSPLVDHLPDSLLTFGEHWGSGIRFPGRIVPVGKPALDRVRNNAPAYQDRDHRVLFVSSNYDHPTVEATVLALRDALPAPWRIVVRPHPVERSTIRTALPGLAGADRIEFDGIDDATGSLLASRAVVGFSSTMLFEALAYGCHVAVVESPLAEHYADDSVFPLRIGAGADVAAVARALRNAPAPTEQRFADRVWLPGAVVNFLAVAAPDADAES